MERARYGVREEIKGTAEAFYRALSQRNLNAVGDLWAQVSYASLAGRSGEVQQGWDRVRRYWENRFSQRLGTPVKVKLSGMVCHAVGDVAWFSGIETRRTQTEDGGVEERLRVTCVLERHSTGWLIVSYHASLPAEPPLAAELAPAS